MSDAYILLRINDLLHDCDATITMNNRFVRVEFTDGDMMQWDLAGAYLDSRKILAFIMGLDRYMARRELKVDDE